LLRRERTIQGKTTTEEVCGLTSLTREQADAKRLLALTRDHWSIENSLHYVRDVTLGEDACRVRKGNAPQVLAALRNALLSLIPRANFPSIAGALRHYAARPAEAVALLQGFG
jgi:predicted transposase YbfD/YdcC